MKQVIYNEKTKNALLKYGHEEICFIYDCTVKIRDNIINPSYDKVIMIFNKHGEEVASIYNSKLEIIKA